MGKGLDRDHRLQRQRRCGQKVQAAILGIQRKDAIQRQQAGQERAKPQDARRDRSQGAAVGADTEWHQRAEDQEKGDAQTKASARPRRQTQIADQQGDHAKASLKPAGRCFCPGRAR